LNRDEKIKSLQWKSGNCGKRVYKGRDFE
jgi:hypothetical protein